MSPDLRSHRPPLAPWPFVRWLWRLTKDVVDEYRDDGVGDLAAAITFWTILSIPAAILALVSMLSPLGAIVGQQVADDLEAEVLDWVSSTFSSQTLVETVQELFGESSAGVATIATLVAIFTLSRAFAGLIRALDQAYEVEEGRPWWYLRIVAIGLGVATIVVVAAGATALAVLPRIPFDDLLRWLTAPAAIVLLIVWAATLFHVGPNHRTPWRYDLPGAVVTALGWILATQGFALYVDLAGAGNQVQTSVGAILLALTLMYLLSIVLLVGAELNDVLARRAGVVRRSPDVTDRARDLRARWRERQTHEPNGGSAGGPAGEGDDDVVVASEHERPRDDDADHGRHADHDVDRR